MTSKQPRLTWTPEKLALLREMVEARCSREQAGKAFDVHPSTCGKRAARMGLKFNPIPHGNGSPSWTTDMDAVLREMWAKGDTATTIGKAIKKTREAVLGRIHRLGLHRSERINAFNRASGGAERMDRVRHLALTPEARAKACETRRANGWSPPKARAAPAAPAAAASVAPVVFAARGMCRAPEGCDKAITQRAYCAEHAARFYVTTPKVDDRKMARWFR